MTSAQPVPPGFYPLRLLTSVSDVTVVSLVRNIVRGIYNRSGSERPLILLYC